MRRGKQMGRLIGWAVIGTEVAITVAAIYAGTFGYAGASIMQPAVVAVQQ